jgi:uncharacterized membrane protein YphA (DoxX/SURF4 family)
MSRTLTTRYANVGLWIAQSLLAAAFLFAGAMKLIMPIDVLEQQAQLPGLFLRFIACAEILGALGLVLPGIFRIHTELTSFAATGIVLIMTGATVIGIERSQVGGSIMPFVLGVTAALIAAKRSEWNAVREPSSELVLRRAA